MTDSLPIRLAATLLLACAAAVAPARIARAIDITVDTTSSGTASAATAPASTPQDPADEDDTQDDDEVIVRHTPHRHHHAGWHSDDGDIVSVGHDSSLAEGQRANNVVSIFGNTTITGTVADSAVAVIGSTYIDGKVEGDVVAVIGDIDLGPNAEVGGDVVNVLGAVHRDPAALVHGGVHHVLSGNFSDFNWLHQWITRCFLYGRPLAPEGGLGWAWSLALGLLAFYACIALVFRNSVNRCVRTIDESPGHTVLAALIAMLLSPVLIVLLCVTVIGIAAIPVLCMAVLCLGLFGKAVSLAWLGHRVTHGFANPPLPPVLAVLVGGAIAIGLYLIPVLGLLMYNLLGFLGFGAVVYALVLAFRTRQAAMGESSPAVAATAPAASPAMPRAGFAIRMLALLVDVLLVGFVMSVLRHQAHFHLIVLATYGAVMWKLRGATVGGSIFGLKVIRSDGRELDWETAIVRALGCFLSLAVVGLGFIWIAFDDGKQAWHDKIAGTLVIRVPKAVPAAAV